ncbi:MAG TPA: hypothetical protein VEL31_15460 [Ktedonobacteraceae bacterium]|nr:hypothetical protein [Ktedonobacteraceae bacterium]
MIPLSEKPITHMVIVGWPVQVHRWATSAEGARALAEKYQARGWMVTVADIRTAQGLIRGDTLSKLLDAADEAFWNSLPSLRLVPGEYTDGSPAPAGITQVEVKLASTHPDIWSVATDVQGGWVAWIMRVSGTDTFRETMGVTTLEGYCRPDCDCTYCRNLRGEGRGVS